MNRCSRCEFYPSHFIIIALSIAAGFTIGFIFFFIPFIFTKAAIAVGLALAIIFLIIISVKTLIMPSITANSSMECICMNYGILLFGILATIIMSLIAIVSFLTIFNIFAAIIVGLWTFAFILMISSFTNLLLCIKNKDCQYYDC